MAERDYRAIAERFREAFTVRHDARAVARLYSEDATIWDPSLPEPLRGRKAIEEWHRGFLRAFPDMSGDYTNVFGAADYFVAEFIMRGTHTGSLEMGPGNVVPPTGKRVEMRGCWVGKLNAQGLIAEDRTYFDSASLMQQLGLLPEAKAA